MIAKVSNRISNKTATKKHQRMSEIEVIDKDPSLTLNLNGHKKDITHLSFNHDASHLVSSSLDHNVLLWNLQSQHQRCYKFSGHTDSVNCVEFSSDGQLIASCSSDQTIRLWLPSIKSTGTMIKAHSSAVNTVSFSPNDDKLITGSHDKSLKLWDTKRKRFLTSFTGHTNWVKCAKFANDESFIASCADDRSLRIWDMKSGQCVHTFTCSKGSGNYLSIHQGGHCVAVAMNSGSVRLYDLRSKKLQQHYILHDSTTCVQWHPRASYLLTSGHDGTMKIVDIMEGKPLYTLEGHSTGVKTVVFSKTGDNFASGGCDKHLLIWNTNFISCQSGSTSTSSLEHEN